MEIQINIEKNGSSKHDLTIEQITFQKMLFLYNAINDGWSVKKTNDTYVFKKNHEGKQEVFLDSYLHQFMKDGFDINGLLR
jgi:hypothetical protein